MSAPNIARRTGSVNGTSSIRTRAISSIRSTSRVTSRLRQVGTVTFQSSSTSKPKPPRIARCSSGGVSSPISSSARSGRNADHRPRRQLAVDVVVAQPAAPASSTRSCVANDAACGARCGSTPFSQRFEPSVRSFSRSELRSSPNGSKLAASSRISVRRVAHLRLLAAHDPGERDRALGVGDHEVALVELALGAVERPELLAARRAADDDPVAGERACGRRRGAGCRARA